MKTPEELNALKEEVENLSQKLEELNADELKQVTGGSTTDWLEKFWEAQKDIHSTSKNPQTTPLPPPVP